MAYTATTSIVLGASQVGKTLNAQLVTTAGADYGSVISSGFVELGVGCYLWTYSFEDDFRGGVKIFNQGDEANLLTIFAINPEEIQQVAELTQLVNNINDNMNTTPKEITIEVPHIATHGTTIDLATGTDGSSNEIEIKTGVR